MSPTSRWHLLSCTAPDVTVFNGRFLWCLKCASLFNPHDIESLSALLARNPPHAPTLQRQEMTLSWPSSVHYRLESAPCCTLPDEFHREQPRHIITDHDPPSASESYVYDYGSLTSTDQVRILELSKGISDDPLHGTLTKCRLQNFAAYEALSYTWASYNGDEPFYGAFRKDIIYLGPFWDAFLITGNCYKALRRLRYPDRTRVLWVDSICINQESKDERNQQVQLMQRIYENALSVVVYLGDEDANSPIALQALSSPERLLYLTSVELDALTALFQRPYFSRLWIVQEITLAKSLHFYCGASETFISLFSGRTLELLLEHTTVIPPWIRYSALRQHTAPRSLWSLLQDTNSCRCSDPRDKLFGILSLTAADSEKELKPDYSLSVEEVYTGIAAFLIREEGLLCVLELAARTPPLKSLPSWAPNWAGCSTSSPRWTTTPFSRTFDSIDLSLLHKGRTFQRRIYSDPKTRLRASSDHLSSYVSVTGTITVEGILFAGRAFDAKHAKYNPLLLQNEYGTLSIAFSFAKEVSGRAGLHQTDDFVLNYQHVLLLGPDYSDALVLEPIDGKDEYTLLRVGKISAIILTGNPIPLPKLLCMQPISGEELEFARNGVLSQPDKFPLLRDSSFIWSKRDFSLVRDSNHLYQFDPGNPEGKSLIGALQDLLSSSFLTYHDTETGLWARWQEFERECMPTFLDPTNMESIARHIRSLKGSSDWNKFKMDFETLGVVQCRTTQFFSLFILEPYKRCVTARDASIKGDSSNEAVSQNDDPSDTLDRLLSWEMCTFDLLRHMDLDIGSPLLLRRLPGQGLPAIARKTSNYHSSIARVVCRGSPGWSGWYAWFMAKKIARNQLETKNLQGEEPKSELRNGTYWDWDHMKNTMEARIAILTEMMEFRRQFEHEGDHYNLHLLAHKLGTWRIMKEVGYDLGDDTIRHRSVTIR